MSREFFREIVDQARDRGLLSDEHFSVDGTLLDAWASMKSFRPKGEDGPPELRCSGSVGGEAAEMSGPRAALDQ